MTKLEQLVQDEYGGDPIRALEDLARRYDIAVAWLNREWFEDHIGREFSDEEWEKIALHLDEYDRWASEAFEFNTSFASYMLIRAGVSV